MGNRDTYADQKWKWEAVLGERGHTSEGKLQVPIKFRYRY